MTVDDKSLQDYLDGRLSGEERTAFEEQVREDAELARRIDSARETREALREGLPELSPGFYARARERFEQSSGKRRRAGWRLLSWEFAGLAAAAVLVLALFVPGVLRDEGAGLEPAMSAPRQEGALGDSEIAPEKESDEIRVRQKAPADDERLQMNQKKMKVAEPEEPAPPLPAPASPTEAAAGRRDVPEATGEEQLRATAVEEDFAPVPEAVEMKDSGESFGRAAAPEPEAAKGRRAAPKREVRLPELGYVEQDRDEDRMAGKEDDKAWRMIDLPRDVTVPGGFLVVDDLSEWSRWLAGPAGDALSELGAPDPAQRLVLIADERGIDCGSIAVHRAEERYVVGRGVATGSRSASGGCAFLLPNDGSSIERD